MEAQAGTEKNFSQVGGDENDGNNHKINEQLSDE